MWSLGGRLKAIAEGHFQPEGHSRRSLFQVVIPKELVHEEMARGVLGKGACVSGDMCGRGMHGMGVCMVGDVHGRGHVWQRGHAWWGVCMAGGHVWWGHAWQGGVCGGGHAWQGMYMVGGHAWWGCAWQGVCMVGVCMAGGLYGRRDSHCSGQYASYWNAFL